MSLADHFLPIELTTSDAISIDAAGGVRGARFNDIYFYPDRGVEETRHVFLQGNDLPTRWRSIQQAGHSAQVFTIAELGFGTGLNFLATTELWLDLFGDSTTTKTLYYYSVEKYPLTAAALQKVFAACQFDFTLADELIQQYPDPVSGDYNLVFEHNGCRVELVLLFGDCLDGLNRLESYPHADSTPSLPRVQAWFMDGFAPSENADMWSASLCQRMATMSEAGTTLATFSVARAVRDQLQQAGFNLQKQPGFGHKRHMLVGQFVSADAQPETRRDTIHPSLRHNACFNRFDSERKKPPSRIAVIGAGIAGCCTAYTLSREGCDVAVFDAAENPGAGASGNPRGILFARTGKQRSALSELHEACYHFATHFYRGLGEPGITDGLQGMLKLGEQPGKHLGELAEIRSRKLLSRQEASAIAGIALREGGLFYPESGSITPQKICQALLQVPGITFSGNTSIDTLLRRDNSWKLSCTQDSSIARNEEFDCVVICCGPLSLQFEPTRWLPIRAIRGQCSQLPATPASLPLKISICDKGYITPSQQGLHDCGATFTLHNHDSAVTLADDHTNRANAMACFDAAMDWPEPCDAQQSRVAFRTTTPDYLPLAGPLSDPTDFAAQYAALANNAKQPAGELAALLPGLYVNTGYGSHGFTLAPLVSKLLVAQVLGLPLPIGDRLRQSVAPNRFLLRSVIRGQA